MGEIICFFEAYNPVFEGLTYVFAIIGGIAGFVGFIKVKAAKKKIAECEKTIRECNVRIDDIHTEIKRITNTITGNNNQIIGKLEQHGMGAKDTDYLINKAMVEKTRYKPDLYYKDENGNLVESPITSIE